MSGSDRESIDLLVELAERSPDFFGRIDEEGIIRYINASGARYLGYEPEQIIGRPTADIHPKWARRILATEAREALERDGYWANDIAYRHKDGHELLTSVTYVAHRSSPADHGVGPVSIVARPVDHRVRAERHILERIPDLKFRMSRSGRYLEFVRGSEEDLYLGPDDFLGKRYEDVLPEEIARLFRKAHNRMVQTGEIQTCDYHLEVQGQVRFFEARMIPLEDDESFTLIRNVTEEVHAERELRKYEAIVAATTDFVGWALPDLSVIDVNLAGRQLLGYDPDEDLSTLSVKDFHPSWAFEKLTEVVVPQALAQGSWEGEIAFQHKDGSEIPASMVLQSHFDKSGELEFLSTISRDIRRQKEAADLEKRLAARAAAAEAEAAKARELQQALEELAEAHERLQSTQRQLRRSATMAAVGRLAGGIAHDFNNLLSVILGHAGLALEQVSENSELYTDVERIQEAARKAATLTQQLLAFGRRRMSSPEVLDINAIVREMSQLLERTLGEDVQLKMRLASVLDPVNMERGSLEQVILNLFINARDAMPRGGTIRVTTENVDLSPDDSAVPHALAPGRHVALTIEDDGLGMSPAVLDRAFEPFFTTKDVGKGTGMGLSTVFGVVQQAKGDIVISSEPGAGTKVRIYLPVTDRAAASTERPDSSKIRSGRGERVLLVEDEATVADLVRRFLERNGYEVIRAVSGEHALRLLDQEAFDVLLTDIVMPEMSGVELAARARRHLKSPRILYISGYPDKGTEYHHLLPEDAIYVQKPFSEAKLLDALQKVLEPVSD